MINEHLGGEECRSPLLSRAYSMARHRRAGARAGAVSAPACGGWLRPPVLAGPLAAARPHFGASAAAPSVGRMGGPLRGFAFARPRPAPPVGSGLGLAFAAAQCAPRAAGSPPPLAALVAGRRCGPPLGAPRCRLPGSGGRRRSAGLGLRFACPAGCSAAAAAVGAACAAQAYKASGFATLPGCARAAYMRSGPLALSHILTHHTACPQVRTAS